MANMACCSGNSLSFLVTGPILVAFLYVLNAMTGGAAWWQWAALGIGLAWVFTLLRAIRLLAMVGGLAGLAALLARRR